MAKRKKKKVKEKPEVVVKKPGMGLDSYFVARKIKLHRQAGMKVYKAASDVGLKTLKEWDEFFKDY